MSNHQRPVVPSLGYIADQPCLPSVPTRFSPGPPTAGTGLSVVFSRNVDAVRTRQKGTWTRPEQQDLKRRAVWWETFSVFVYENNQHHIYGNEKELIKTTVDNQNWLNTELQVCIQLQSIQTKTLWPKMCFDTWKIMQKFLTNTQKTRKLSSLLHFIFLAENPKLLFEKCKENPNSCISVCKK